jgi:hypothetical protein
VQDIRSVTCAGFSLTILPLLSLGADQEEKLMLGAKHAEGTIILTRFSGQPTKNC